VGRFSGGRIRIALFRDLGRRKLLFLLKLREGRLATPRMQKRGRDPSPRSRRPDGPPKGGMRVVLRPQQRTQDAKAAVLAALMGPTGVPTPHFGQAEKTVFPLRVEQGLGLCFHRVLLVGRASRIAFL